jgi:uncharacterized membrane protein YeaQ/YmgE (transglycosylase-associated protein family)
MEWILAIVVGALVGWLAYVLAPVRRSLPCVLLGIVGAVLRPRGGRWAWRRRALRRWLLSAIAAGLVGSCVRWAAWPRCIGLTSLLRAGAAGLSLMALLACGGEPPAPAEGRKLKGARVREGAPVAAPAWRPSASRSQRLGHLFVVGDRNVLAELDGDGSSGASVDGLEDVTVHTPTGPLLLGEQGGADRVLGCLLGEARWRLDADEVVGHHEKGATASRACFRAVSGVSAAGSSDASARAGPAGGIRSTTSRTSASSQLRIVGRWPLSGHRDLTSVTWSAALDRLLVLAAPRTSCWS